MTGFGIGWLAGLSVSPVVSIVLTSITGIVATIIAALNGVKEEFLNSETSPKVLKRLLNGVTPVPIVPVESYEAGVSPYGLLQMAGNVSEWTNSRYEPTKEDMVYRGGAFHHQPLNLRTPEREDRNPGFTNRGLGFRVVRDALSN